MKIATLLLLLIATLGVAQQPAAPESLVRFQAVDIFLDSRQEPLAAYQLEFLVTNGNAKIVGIEGGQHPAFKAAPHYDPAAMQQERVIIAGFTTSTDLPNTKTRVSTIHLQLTGNATPQFQIRLMAAGNQHGKSIKADATLTERTSR